MSRRSISNSSSISNNELSRRNVLILFRLREVKEASVPSRVRGDSVEGDGESEHSRGGDEDFWLQRRISLNQEEGKLLVKLREPARESETRRYVENARKSPVKKTHVDVSWVSWLLENDIVRRPDGHARIGAYSMTTQAALVPKCLPSGQAGSRNQSALNLESLTTSNANCLGADTNNVADISNAVDTREVVSELTKDLIGVWGVK